jgi:WS/DGAT/MGAT family acyltransferase
MDFDIDDHIRRVPVPEFATQNDLWRIVSGLMSTHLDRTRPLWTFDVIGPLADGREAVAARIHHAMADGIAGVRFLESVLFDARAESPDPGISSDPGTPRPKLAVTPPTREEELRRLPGAIARELGHRDSHSPFDRPITIARELAFAVAPLAEMKRIGASRPSAATVNDVLLAIIAGGLREWLPNNRHLHAQVPVSLHHRDEGTSAPGNHDSFMNVDLPLGESDPLARLDRISAETARRKRLDDAEEMYDLFHALGRVKIIDRAVQRLAGSAGEFSLAISNVPGPATPVSIADRSVENLFSSSEPGTHHALRISAISCSGEVGIGLCTDPSALPGIADLADAITRSYVELRSAATSM